MLKQVRPWHAPAATAPGGAHAGLLVRDYWLTGVGLVLVYLLVERATLLYELDGLGITLWSPSAGLSLTLLLMRGVRFAPFIFVACLATEAFIYSGPRGPIAMIGTSLVLASGLSLTALACEKISAGRPHHASLAGTLALLALASAGAFIIAVAFCAVLYATDVLYGWRFFIAVRNHWIGNTLGMVTVAPAIPALVALGWPPARPSRGQVLETGGFVVALGAALSVIFGLESANEYQFFYLLFLPIIWVAIRAGHAAAAVALLATHLALVTIATHVRYAAFDFIGFQMLMLVLSATGLLLGAVVTERRRSEDRLRVQQGELARAVRHATVGAMGTALAHEISQPMSSAANYLHAARRLLRATGDAEGPIADALARSEAESRRARAALERVRDYVSTGRMELVRVDFEILADKIANLVRRDADVRGVGIRITKGLHLPLIWADQVQIELLVANLVTNAIDASASASTQYGLVELHVYQSGHSLVVQVSDNGPGVAPEVADRILEPFETTKSGGMGLGLTVAQRIVEVHGGSLAWEARKPQGMSFTAKLPIDGPQFDAA